MLLFFGPGFRLTGPGHVDRTHAGQRPEPRGCEAEADHDADHVRPPHRGRARPQAPGDAERPEAIGKVKHGRQHADRVKNRHQCGLERLGSRARGVVRIEPPTPQGLAEPVQLRDVPDDEGEGDHAGRPLQRVPHVADIRIRADVGHAIGDNHKTDRRVKQHGQKNEGPFDRHEQRPERVDHVHPRLERPTVVSGQNRGVGQQVHGQKRSDRNQPRQREQPIDQKLVTFQERRG